MDMITEYACHSEIDENVCVIVCGRNTRFQHYYSNQYADIKRRVGESNLDFHFEFMHVDDILLTCL